MKVKTLQEYNEKLNNAIELAARLNYDEDVIYFLRDLQEIKRPVQYHSCDDPDCIVCGSGM